MGNSLGDSYRDFHYFQLKADETAGDQVSLNRVRAGCMDLHLIV